MSATIAALATRHGKESLFGPPFARLGTTIMVAPVDTDTFGTFAGEVERVGSPAEVVERKARAAAAAADLTVGLASEGSFGTHPTIPFAIIDTELVAWVDISTDHVVIERATAVSAVPATATVGSVDEIDGLRIVPMLPEQAAIVVVEDTATHRRTVIAKEVREVLDLRAAVARGLNLGGGSTLVEPDLRAHCCPDRRAVITEAVERLVDRLAHPCPDCHSPGYGVVGTAPGLPCSLCGLPTTVARADRLECGRCRRTEESARPGRADPTHCDRCNP